MKIHIDDIPEQGLRLDLGHCEDIIKEALQELAESDAFQVSPFLKGDIRILADEKQITMFGEIQAQLHMSCSRCLKNFQSSQFLDVSLVWNRCQGPGTQDGDYPEEDEDGIPYIDGEEFDPGEAILQEILLSVPMKPLCDESCPGLCSVCGGLLNSTECVCSKEKPVDPRWDKIKDLKAKLDES